MTPTHQSVARDVLEAHSYREMYAALYHQKRQDLLEDLLTVSRNSVVSGPGMEERRARAVSEICGQAEQMREHINDLFKLAGYKDSEPNPSVAWQLALESPIIQPQESRDESWKQQPQQPRVQHRRLSRLAAVCKVFWTKITLILQPMETKAEK